MDAPLIRDRIHIPRAQGTIPEPKGMTSMGMRMRLRPTYHLSVVCEVEVLTLVCMRITAQTGATQHLRSIVETSPSPNKAVLE